MNKSELMIAVRILLLSAAVSAVLSLVGISRANGLTLNSEVAAGGLIFCIILTIAYYGHISNRDVRTDRSRGFARWNSLPWIMRVTIVGLAAISVWILFAPLSAIAVMIMATVLSGYVLVQSVRTKP